MTSINAVVPSQFACQVCKKAADKVETDVQGTVIAAICNSCDAKKKKAATNIAG